VSSITLANTAAHIGSEAIWDARVAAVQAGGMAAIREAVLSRFLSAGYRQSHPAVTQHIGEMLLNSDQQGYIAACLALRAADLRPQLFRIQASALILGGELDESTPPAQAQELHAALPGSQLYIFPATAHLSNVEHPEEFSQRLRAFLQQVQANTTA
jgi:pimeloyl-ACP methyl ester carboxylesterase